MVRALPPARLIDTGAVRLSTHLAGPEDGPPVLLCHGWPELAYSWVNQIEPLAAAGYRVIAPDQRGFGGSDAPAATDDYGIDALVGDLTGLLDALGHEKAVFVGHDWGGVVVWHAAMLAPERVAGVIGVNTPHLPAPPQSPLALLEARFGPQHYILEFQPPGVAEAAFSGREEAFFTFMFRRPKPIAEASQAPVSGVTGEHPTVRFLSRFAAFPDDADSWNEAHAAVPRADRDIYAQAFRRSGFAGGLNWYRNMAANAERMGGVDPRIDKPCLMVLADEDIFLPPIIAAGMGALIADLTTITLENCGHWTMWETPERLTAEMLTWLAKRFPSEAGGPLRTAE